MGPTRRVEIPGGIFHVTARGNDKAAIFRGENDYVEFLRKLAEVVVESSWPLHSYCLMPNHFHLLIETPEPNLAVGMRRLNGRWAASFNRRHAHSGHVFQGPYGATPVARDEHLIETFRYIALNPVRAGLCREPEDWRWSSYAAMVGLCEPPSFLALDLVRSFFGSAGLRDFVAEAERPRPG